MPELLKKLLLLRKLVLKTRSVVFKVMGVSSSQAVDRHSFVGDLYPE
jgi:hypothetical protein